MPAPFVGLDAHPHAGAIGSASRGALDTHRRWDAAFHLSAAALEPRAQELARTVPQEQAVAWLRAFPIPVIAQACASLHRGQPNSLRDEVIAHQAEHHPFLALAMLEQGLPAALETCAQRVRCAQAQEAALRGQAAALAQALSPPVRRKPSL